MSLWVNENGVMKEISIDDSENSSLLFMNHLSESSWDINLDQQFAKILDWVGWGQTLHNQSKAFALKVKTLTLPFSCNVLGVNLYKNNLASTAKESAILDNLSSVELTDMYYERRYNEYGDYNNGLLVMPGEFFRLSNYRIFDRFEARISGFDYPSVEFVISTYNNSRQPVFEFKDNRTINLYTFPLFRCDTSKIIGNTCPYPTRAQLAGATITKTYANINDTAIEFRKVL